MLGQIFNHFDTAYFVAYLFCFLTYFLTVKMKARIGHFSNETKYKFAPKRSNLQATGAFLADMNLKKPQNVKMRERHLTEACCAYMH